MNNSTHSSDSSAESRSIIEQDQGECKVCGSTKETLTDLAVMCGHCAGRVEASTRVNKEDIQEQLARIETDDFSPPPLFGDHTPAVVLQRENTRHRAICYLIAQGMSNVEVAEAVGVSAVMVAYTKKQPHSAALINEIQDTLGRKKVMRILSDAAEQAAKTIVAISNGTLEAKPSDRGKAANSILDRLWGTAPQVVMHGKVDTKEVTDEDLVKMLNEN